MKRNIFAKNRQGSSNSFLNLVKVITESDDMDETEGLDFEDDDLGGEDDFDMEDDDLGEDDFGAEDDGETITISIPRAHAESLIEALQAALDGGEEEFGDDDEFGGEEDLDDDFGGEDDFGGDDEFGDEDEEEEDETEEDEEGDEDEAEEVDEDEEVLGSDQSNVAQSTISRNGAPKRSKFSKQWDNSKTVKSIFDQTASGEGEPAGTSRDGAPKRSKASGSFNANSKTVKSRLQPGKHMFEIGK